MKEQIGNTSETKKKPRTDTAHQYASLFFGLLWDQLYVCFCGEARPGNTYCYHTHTHTHNDTLNKPPQHTHTHTHIFPIPSSLFLVLQDLFLFSYRKKCIKFNKFDFWYSGLGIFHQAKLWGNALYITLTKLLYSLNIAYTVILGRVQSQLWKVMRIQRWGKHLLQFSNLPFQIMQVYSSHLHGCWIFPELRWVEEAVVLWPIFHD